MTKQLTIKDFSVSWTADHEQCYPGHGIALTPYTHCATGCGSTLREAFEDALEDLAQQDIYPAYSGDFLSWDSRFLVELASQVKEPAMLDMDIVQACCDVQGEHSKVIECTDEDCDVCEACGAGHVEDDISPDCAVCAGEWHFYVSIDVTVEGETI